MISGLWNGFSGLNTYEKGITSEANNSSNTNTPGYKASDIRFEDLMYKSNGAGTGAAVEAVYKRFQQGDITPTEHSLDFGIEGKGYFIVNRPEDDEAYYTRAGNFSMDDAGFLKTPDGLRVQGLVPQEVNVISTTEQNNKISSDFENFLTSQTIQNDDFVQTINARATDYKKTATDIGTPGEGFKTASAQVVDIESLVYDYKDKLSLYSSQPNAPAVESQSQITQLDYSSYLNELSDENDFIKINIDNQEVRQRFDTDVETTLRSFADKISGIEGLKGSIDPTLGSLTVESIIPAKEISIYDAAVNDKAASIYAVQNQQLGSGYGLVTSVRDRLKTAIENAGGEFLQIDSKININQPQQELTNIQMKLENLGLSEYGFGGITSDNENIYLNDGDNKFVIGRLQTAFFRNDQGLEPEGNNLYRATNEAGEPQAANFINKIYSSTLERSNTNNADTMTNLLTYQKAYESNSKSITTSDELLKIAINLKK
ncbi:MAG: flagellar hook-basal body complex protein [Campylobacterota bacterium]